MKNLSRKCLLVACSVIVLAGCSAMQSSIYVEDAVSDNGEPGYITVQHCLISFQDLEIPGVTRSEEEATALAQELFEKAKAGEDFDQIVRDHTDDSPPGIYKMANDGFESDTKSSRIPSRQIFPRSGMVPAFGNVGFKLKVGEFGLAPFDPNQSKFGWHIIKRIK